MLAIGQVRDRAHLHPRRVVDADLRTDVTASVDVDPRDRPAPREQSLEIVRAMETLVARRDDQPRGAQATDQLGQGCRGGALRVVRAAGGAAVDALVCDAVTRGRVPANERLPEVVVREVGVLVVGRVDVDEIDIEAPARARSRRAGLPDARRPVDGQRHAELERVVRARRPALEERHLQAGRAVDAIGGLEQRGQDDAEFELSQIARFDRVADGVDAAAVVRLEVASALAEDVADVALTPLEPGELLEQVCERGAIRRPRPRRRCRPGPTPTSRSRGRWSGRPARGRAAPARRVSCRRRDHMRSRPEAPRQAPGSAGRAHVWSRGT